MKPVTSKEIRQSFLDFFNEMGHTVVPSAPLPLYDNPTLFFTNAGMNQFVDAFLGKEKRPYSRAATAQKCMRVQGKHNDLENVGPSPRHHTYFEMLGNFSFGDYFKQRAIRYAYDFLTIVCQIPPDRLFYTVHTGDEEAFDIWVSEIKVPAERVLRMGDKTNFWMMGDVGPCGPTSEVHYDWGPEACTCQEPDCSVLLDNDCDRWLEIWNLVFMQFNQGEDGQRTPLPRPGVDTGMGLERLTGVQQQQPVNYDTDLFLPAMNRVQEMLGDSADERRAHETGYRVIADHGRAATFLLADGVMPGNVGGSYVLRMIIRRAARFGREIGFTEPFLAEIAQAYIDYYGDVFSELRTRRDFILHTLQHEEERFARTLDAALAQLESLLADLAKTGEMVIPGEIAFDLYATHGLPLEITRDVAMESGFGVDEAGFKAARAAHAAASGSGAIGEYETEDSVYAQLRNELIRTGRLPGEGVVHDPYGEPELTAVVAAILLDGEPVERAVAGQKIELITNATPFYVEAGGEVSDTGRIMTPGGKMQVRDMQEPVPRLVVHVGEVVSGEISVGQDAQLFVDNERRADIRRNHTATHILHRELRHHLGSHVLQGGSLVAPDRLRFDFTHNEAVGKEKLQQIERDINAAILGNYPVGIAFMGQKEAINSGAMALFGEKYGDVVRTIRIGDPNQPYSFELCGGLHVSETNDIGSFRFTHEEAVGAGLRRVEAVTGRAAQELVRTRLAVLDQISGLFNVPSAELYPRVEALLAEQKTLQKENEQLRQQLLQGQFDRLLAQTQTLNGLNLLTAIVENADAGGLRTLTDRFRDQYGSGVVVLGTVQNNKPLLVAAVTDDLVQRGVKAGDLVKQAARIVGGGGGGRPHLAQAGGRDAHKLSEALDAVPKMVAGMLGEG